MKVEARRWVVRGRGEGGGGRYFGRKAAVVVGVVARGEGVYPESRRRPGGGVCGGLRADARRTGGAVASWSALGGCSRGVSGGGGGAGREFVRDRAVQAAG